LFQYARSFDLRLRHAIEERATIIVDAERAMAIAIRRHTPWLRLFAAAAIVVRQRRHYYYDDAMPRRLMLFMRCRATPILFSLMSYSEPLFTRAPGALCEI